MWAAMVMLTGAGGYGLREKDAMRRIKGAVIDAGQSYLELDMRPSHHQAEYAGQE